MLDPAFVRMAREAPFLEPDAERALIQRAHAGDAKSREAVLKSHYRLVIQEAAKRNGYAVPIADLVQEGIAGMTEALNRFEPHHEVRFSTYAMWWIKAAMSDAVLRDHSIVRRNTTRTDKTLFFKLRGARAALERSSRLSPAQVNEELAKRFETTVKEIASMTAYLVQGDKALNATIPLSENEAMEYVDMLVDDGPLPDEIVRDTLDGSRLTGIIGRALASLSARERAIIVGRRYPADPDEVMTLDDLSKILGITRERVRQIEQRALEKLRDFLEAEGVGPRYL